MTITRERLDDWQALCDAATDGPWADDFNNVIHANEDWIAETADGDDADLIVAARTAMPLLIARVRELEALPVGIAGRLLCDARGNGYSTQASPDAESAMREFLRRWFAVVGREPAE